MDENTLRLVEIWAREHVAPSHETALLLIAEIRRLQIDNELLRQQVEGHAARIAAQSELLSREAERSIS